MKFRIQNLFGVVAFVMALLFVSVAVGQEPDKAKPPSLTGKYEGTVKDSTGEMKVTLDLMDDSGKFSGAMTTSLGVFKVVKGQMVDGLLTLEFETKGPPHKISVRQKDDQLVGTAVDGNKTPAIELRRVKADEISGEWDAAADVQGQAFPFTLSLKLEGEKVSGSSNSQLGSSNISSGVWKDGKLALVVDGANGAIGLVATLVDGKLVGDYDFAGQLQGKWVAVRKK
jgi:hypothetical protein